MADSPGVKSTRPSRDCSLHRFVTNASRQRATALLPTTTRTIDQLLLTSARRSKYIIYIISISHISTKTMTNVENICQSYIYLSVLSWLLYYSLENYHLFVDFAEIIRRLFYRLTDSNMAAYIGGRVKITEANNSISIGTVKAIDLHHKRVTLEKGRKTFSLRFYSCTESPVFTILCFVHKQ